MNNLESAEDYLEAILIIENKKGKVRAIDIANHLDFSKPSVSIALKKLKAKGLIEIEEETSCIKLTSEGRAIAENTYEKHTIISKALIKLGVPEEIAMEDACKIEHDISKETFEKLKEHLLNWVE